MSSSIKLLICLASSFSFLNAVILERDSLVHIYEFLTDEKPENVIIACDIDNTLARTPGMLGSDQWFYGMFTFYAQEKGISFDEAIAQLVPDYVAIQKKTPLSPVESITPFIIQDLQSHGYCVLGLTARSFTIIERTYEQLNEIDINFTHTKNINFDPIDGSLGHPYHYKYGTMFCGNNNKGHVLFALLSQLNKHPHCVIFIDDKLKNIHAVEQEVERHGIKFIGIRYNRMDHEIQHFDPIEGDRLLKEFQQQDTIS
jgi:hypothetical protein